MVDVMISGPDGRLEARYHHAEEPSAPMALVLHPHPQHGGTMNNKVVYAIYQCFRERGFSVLRFNFRGVGRSQGKFDHGFGELSDAAAALDWMQTHNPNASACWIAGFSFGAWIAMQVLMRRPEIHGFVAVAPPANHFDFTFLAPCPSSGLIVQGNKDDIVPEPNVAKLAQRLQSQRQIEVDYRVIKGANHLFEDKLDQLSSTVGSYLHKAVQPKKAAAAS
ncbi:MAG: alpha/beta hydrolase [Alphaproteobacteria bacterium]